MNTIKITLRTSGSVADLFKDFNLYVGGYNNKMIEVYVPKSIIYTNEENTFINAVKIGAILTSTSGALVNTNSYFLDYVDDEVVNGITYAVYERQLPQEFTVYQGTQQIVANLVNIDNTDPENPVTLSVVTTQIANVDVLLSAYIVDEVLEPSQVEVIMAELALKQDADTTGNTTEINIAPISTTKSVVPAINALGTQININTGNITANTEDIATNTEAIAYLEAHMTTGENFVGTFPTQTTMPTSGQLDTFVFGIKGRTPLNGDVVFFTLTVEGGTDLTYKYFYTAEGWSNYQIPSIEASSNGTLGSLKGTYGVGSTNTTLVDIAGGQILNIWIKDGTDTYRNIREYINTNATSIANIIAGNTSVGQAVKALQDELGNNIVNTYLTQNTGASKQYVRDYSLPREFNDIYFIASTGYQAEVPTTPESGIQFTATSTAIGDTTIFEIEKVNDADFELSSKNSSSNAIYVSANQNCTVYFRMTTQAQNDGVNWLDLSVELTNATALTAGEIYKIALGTTFSNLGTNVISMTTDDLIRQKFEVVTQSSTTTVFNVYSNATYPSSYNMNTQAQVIITAQGDLGEQPVYEIEGVLTDNILTFALGSTEILNDNTEAEFKLTYTTVSAPADTVEMVLSLNEQNIRLVTPYNINTGNATVGYFKQTNNLFESGVQSWTFKGFIQANGSETEVLVDIDDLTSVKDMLTQISNVIYIDGAIGNDTNSGNVNAPLLTISGAITLANTLTGATGFEIHIAQGTYTESGDITLPNKPIVIYGNNATISNSGHTITIPNPYFIRYNLFTVSNVVYDNFTAGARCVVQGGGITGNVTINSYVEMLTCQLTGGTVTVGATGQLLCTICSPTSTFVSAGSLFLDRVNINTGKTSYLINSTGGQLTVSNSLITNLSTGGCIHCENGATTTPNILANNFIVAVSGNTVLAGTAYTIYSKNYVAGTAPSGSVFLPVNSDITGAGNIMALGSDATGDIYYRNVSGLLTRLGIGASGKILGSNGTIPTWTDMPTNSVTEVVDATTKVLIHATASVPFNLYLEAGTTKDTNINWGDNSNEDITSWGTKQHTYTTTGYYWITITANTGTVENMPQLYVNNQTDKALYYKVILSNLLSHIGNNFCYGCSNLETVMCQTYFSWGMGLLSPDIGEYAFYGCGNLVNFEFPYLCGIGAYAFYNCFRLAINKIENNDFVPSDIGAYAFYNCLGIQELTLPYYTGNIGVYAFANCDNINKLNIISINSGNIENNAFANCSQLKEINIYATSIFDIGTNVFSGISSNAVIYVPHGTLEAYRTATNWSTYASIIQELVLKEEGKELSDNNLTDALKSNYDTAYSHSQLADGTNPHATTFANIQTKPTTLGGYGITDALSSSLKGATNGLAELDSTGKVPSTQLPSYVDDIIEVTNFASLPAIGETGKIYVTLDTNLTYRWGGTEYVEISSSLALGETSSTAYRGDRGKTAYDHSKLTSGNPHSVTKTNVGLGNAYNPTAYGGISYGGGAGETGVSFTDLNTLAFTGFYTCFGTTANVPSNSYSWFIEHMNSNVGTASATQIATAYASEPTIYVRTKISSVWGSWVKIPTANDTKTYTTVLPTTSGGASDWQAVTGGYELAKTITGLTVYDSIVAVASDDTIWTTNELNATLTANTLTFFVSSLPSAEVTLTYTITKSVNGGSI